MKDSKINKNRKPLSDEEVKKAENFDDILSKLKASQGNFIQKNWGYLASAIVLGILGVFMLGKPEKNKKITTEIKKFEIIAPIDGLTVPNSIFTINAGEKGQIVTKTGTIINYLANAFVDAQGNSLSGEIEIQFREFHDIVEIFASGIPMEYDSASNKYHFESAGMFDMKGFQNRTPIFINPKTPLVVELASKQQGDYFNLYRLDDSGKWHFIEKDTAKGVYEMQFDSTELAKLPKQIKALEKREKKAKNDTKKAEKSFDKLLKDNNIYKPIVANDKLYAINLESDKKEFPELVPFKNILFEITENNKDFTPDLATKDWDDVQLKKKKNGKYQLVMFDKMKQFKFIVRPVISAKNMATATTSFDNLFKNYDTKLGGKLSEEKRERDSLKKIYKSISDSINILNNFASTQAFNLSEVEKTTETVKRIFTINSFGIFNSDCPQNLPKGVLFEPVFVNNEDITDTLSFDHIYMAELNKNALYSLYGYWGKPKKIGETAGEMYLSQEISFNSYHKTVVWGITTDNRLAIIKPEEMINLKKGGNLDVEMYVTKDKISDLNILRKLLGFT